MANCKDGIDARFCAQCSTPRQDTPQLRRRRVELRADALVPSSEVERDCYEAVYAYEEVLSANKGKATRAGRTWPMIKRKGVIAAVEEIVTRKTEAPGYTNLVEMGMKDKTFEAVVLRHPADFSAEAVASSERRLHSASEISATNAGGGVSLRAARAVSVTTARPPKP